MTADADGESRRACRRRSSPRWAIATSRSWRAGRRAGRRPGSSCSPASTCRARRSANWSSIRCSTPHIAAAELKRRLDAGEEVLIVDSRPIGEFRNMSIPGAFDCPGAELVYRVPDRLRSPRQPRRRQLRRAHAQHHRRPIAAQCRAREPGHGARKRHDGLGTGRARTGARPRRCHCRRPRPPASRRPARWPTRSPQRFGIRRIDDAALARFAGEAEERTLYMFDVRSPEEYAARPSRRRTLGAGRPAGAGDRRSTWRPAMPASSSIDDDGVRAVMTGSWLRADGLARGLCARRRAGGAEAGAAAPRPRSFPELERGARPRRSRPAELKALLDRGAAAVVDLAPSIAYEAGHIPGAWFAVRARLARSLDRVPRRRLLVLTSPDGRLARLAAAELAASAVLPRSGCSTGRHRRLARRRAAARDRPRGDGRHPDDCWRRPYDPYAGAGARERYLRWEIELGAPDRARGRCRVPHSGLAAANGRPGRT